MPQANPTPAADAEAAFWARLQGKIQGELFFDLTHRQQFQKDASVYKILPSAVVFPKNLDDLHEVVTFARKSALSIHPWGAGTSRAGQPLGEGLIVNFRRHFTRILFYDEETFELTVEPGVAYSEVQSFLRERGRSFPPDPCYPHCTIGGMVASNTSGIHGLKHGGCLELVSAITFMDGEGRIHSSRDASEISEGAEKLVRKYWPLIEAEAPKVENISTGYHLDASLAGGTFDLTKLLVGSEGTLGLFTSITLKTLPLKAPQALAICYFPSLEAALQAALDLRTFDPSACELVDKVVLDLHSSAEPSGSKRANSILSNPYLRKFYVHKAQAMLVVEMEGDSAEDARAQLQKALTAVSSPAEIAKDQRAMDLMWDLHQNTSPILNKLENGKVEIKPLWNVEDVSLPPAKLVEYVQKQRQIYAKFDLVCSFFGHVAAANIHMDPVHLGAKRYEQTELHQKLFAAVAEESFALVVSMGGAISGEHGDGLSRTPFLPMQYPRTFPLFEKLKNTFDPFEVFNPGKKIVLENLGSCHV